jgi:hypothetical protein
MAGSNGSFTIFFGRLGGIAARREIATTMLATAFVPTLMDLTASF